MNVRSILILAALVNGCDPLTDADGNFAATWNATLTSPEPAAAVAPSPTPTIDWCPQMMFNQSRPRPDAVVPPCGNGVVDLGELCDTPDRDFDGIPNAEDNDDDNDGILNSEDTDDDNDGILDDADANENNCNSNCTVSACGNGIPDFEACDDGNSNDLDSCTNRCTFPTCGDGVPTEGEACGIFETVQASITHAPTNVQMNMSLDSSTGVHTMTPNLVTDPSQASSAAGFDQTLFGPVLSFDIGPTGSFYLARDAGYAIPASGAAFPTDAFGNQLSVTPAAVTVTQVVVDGKALSDEEFTLIVDYVFDCGESGSIKVGEAEPCACDTRRLEWSFLAVPDPFF